MQEIYPYHIMKLIMERRCKCSRLIQILKFNKKHAKCIRETHKISFFFLRKRINQERKIYIHIYNNWDASQELRITLYSAIFFMPTSQIILLIFFSDHFSPQPKLDIAPNVFYRLVKAFFFLDKKKLKWAIYSRTIRVTDEE